MAMSTVCPLLNSTFTLVPLNFGRARMELNPRHLDRTEVTLQKADKLELDDDQCQELSVLAKQIPCPFARNKKCHYDDESCTYGYVPFFTHHFPDLQKKENY